MQIAQKLVEGIAIVEAHCEAKMPAVCESKCQANAKSPEECLQDNFIFEQSKTKMTYPEAEAFCTSKNQVMLHYNIFKVNHFRSMMAEK